VVFLDEHLVEQADPVVLRASLQDRVFLRRPQSWQCLARVEDRAVSPGYGIYVTPRGSGRGREKLQEVECRPFASEDRSGETGYLEQSLVRSDVVTIVRVPGHAHGRVELPECFGHPWAAAEDGLLASDYFAGDMLSSGDQLGGYIAGADVLAEGRGDLLEEICWERWHGAAKGGRVARLEAGDRKNVLSPDER
jgi:hypothetical protein